MSVLVMKLKKWKDSRPNRNTFPTSHLETWDERQRRKAALLIIYIKTLVYFSVVAMVMPPTWPYLQSLDPNASKTLVGWIIVGVPALRPVNALLVGWLLKKFSIRAVTIVSGVFILVSCAMWSTAYHAPIYGGYWLLISRFVIGFFGAEFQIGTTHVASATTKEERSTAMTILAGCLSIAYMMAPGVMSAISFVGPVGITVCGFILNMYTVAGLLGLAVYAAALGLFCFYYEESDIAVREEKLAEATSGGGSASSDPEEDLFPSRPVTTDYLAVAVCNLVGAHCYGWLQLPDTMMTPMAMDLYGWSEEHAVRRAGNILTLYGILALAGFALSGRLAKRFPERGIMLGGTLMYLVGALVMFPVMGPTPPMAGPPPGNNSQLEVNVTALHLMKSYRSPGGHAYVMNLAEGGRQEQLPLQLRDLDPVTGRQLGCPATQSWCLTEPRPHLAQLIISFGLVMCATPFVLPMVNSCISKLLPAGNQSVMWGIVNGSANVGRLIYPLLNIYLYTFLGVRAQYGVMIGLCALCVVLLLVTFRRLRPRQETGDKIPLTDTGKPGYGATKADQG
ncbi:major facilitator superfamily domain-containing protein 8-like [Amphibalanus amphitrite]|uniref:major facilitator superfamily domain-containing protein 8-like n=1 Tax=Amphibalanus amphitrite TaxID=1232801 RepID=UPI001C915259|nr:major facilitator superfamily domain-containing protein 8-like [Amphibalanus amphitrite]